MSDNTSTDFSSQQIFVDLKTNLSDVKSVLDPSNLLTTEEFFQVLHKKLTESYATVLDQVFHNQYVVRDKMLRIFTILTTLTQMTICSIPTAHPQPNPTDNEQTSSMELEPFVIKEEKTSPTKIDSNHDTIIISVENDSTSNLQKDESSRPIDFKMKSPKEDTIDNIDKQNTDDKMKKQFKCDHCNYATSLRANLKRHWHTHKNVALLNCDLCSKKFVDKRKFRAHKKEHAANGKEFKCIHCDFNGSSKTELKIHSTKHKLHQCHHCDKSYMRKSSLQQHIKRIAKTLNTSTVFV